MAKPPKSISPEAQAYMTPNYRRHAYPRSNDAAAWRAFIDEHDATLIPSLRLAARKTKVSVAASKEDWDGVTVYGANPAETDHPGRAVFYLPMGGMTLLAGEAVLYFAVVYAAQFRHRLYAVDFSRPPEHPFPAGLDDCLTAYKALLTRYEPADIAFVGDSGGANLAAALCLRARDEGLPLPASMVLRWPHTDLTESGDSFVTNRQFDVILQGGTPEMNALYLAGHDPGDPYASPLFGDFSKGFPPTMLLSGTRDEFLSNAVRMHRALRAAEVDTALHIYEAMPHGGFGHSSPEDADVLRETVRFVTDHWK